MKAVSNASPLIALARAKLISLLPELTVEMVIPAAVADEIRAGPQGDPAREWLEQQSWARILEITPPLSELGQLTLGRGEAEVIEWARRSGEHTALLDYRSARRAAVALGIPVCGTLGLLARAASLGLVGSFAAATDALAEAGFYFDSRLINEISRRFEQH